MDLKAVMGFIFYWLILTGLYTWVVVPGGGGLISQNTTSVTWTSPGNITQVEDTGSSNFFGTLGNAIGNIISLLAFLIVGIGLPADTPAWFAWLFGGIIFSINVVLAAVIINSFWSGGKG